MKSTEKKAEFIERRAQGESFSKIAAALQISKSTCSEWEKEFRIQISECRQERLQELYTLYGMHKEARIEKLGSLLGRIDTALDAIDLAELPAEKLLDMRIKYTRELQKEYEHISMPITENSLEAILEQFKAVLERSQSGSISAAQAKAETATISKALETMKAIDKRDNPLDLFSNF